MKAEDVLKYNEDRKEDAVTVLLKVNLVSGIKLHGKFYADNQPADSVKKNQWTLTSLLSNVNLDGEQISSIT